MTKLAVLGLVLTTAAVAVAQPAEPQAVTTTGTVVVVSPTPVVVTSAAAIAGPAAAAPVPVPAAAVAASAPQTHAWEEVNHINGTLVPVGQENDYLKRFRRWNVSTNPIGYMYGSYGVSVSYGLNSNLAIRGDLNYFDPPGSNSYEATGVDVGVALPIYFRRTYQGLFLEPGIISRTFSERCGGCRSSSDTNTTFGPQVLVGWHWTWSSGLNFAVAAGAGRNWAARDSEYGSDEVFGNGYMRFGYAF
ncbi:MAG: DUF3575 domain-containing protein [Myxococcales bacterium]|nr:DUF3575 domain-containing protein [Myxococcales bacterium]